MTDHMTGQMAALFALRFCGWCFAGFRTGGVRTQLVQALRLCGGRARQSHRRHRRLVGWLNQNHSFIHLSIRSFVHSFTIHRTARSLDDLVGAAAAAARWNARPRMKGPRSHGRWIER